MTTTDLPNNKLPTGADALDNDADHANYRFNLRSPKATTGQHMRAVVNGDTYLPAGDPLLYAARQLDYHTGHKPVLVWDGGQYLGLHVYGNNRHHVLADHMGGRPQLLVLYETSGSVYTAGSVEVIVMRQDFASWQDLAEAAAAIDLR